MRKSPDVSPRRLSDISPQLRQLKYLVVDEAIKEDLKSSRSVEDINSASIEERILRITGYYGYQPWSTSYKSESVSPHSLHLYHPEKIVNLKKKKIRLCYKNTLINLTPTDRGFRIFLDCLTGQKIVDREQFVAPSDKIWAVCELRRGLCARKMSLFFFFSCKNDERVYWRNWKKHNINNAQNRKMQAKTKK